MAGLTHFPVASPGIGDGKHLPCAAVAFGLSCLVLAQPGKKRLAMEKLPSTQGLYFLGLLAKGGADHKSLLMAQDGHGREGAESSPAKNTPIAQ